MTATKEKSDFEQNLYIGLLVAVLFPLILVCIDVFQEKFSYNELEFKKLNYDLEGKNLSFVKDSLGEILINYKEKVYQADVLEGGLVDSLGILKRQILDLYNKHSQIEVKLISYQKTENILKNLLDSDELTATYREATQNNEQTIEQNKKVIKNQDSLKLDNKSRYVELLKDCPRKCKY